MLPDGGMSMVRSAWILNNVFFQRLFVIFTESFRIFAHWKINGMTMDYDSGFILQKTVDWSLLRSSSARLLPLGTQELPSDYSQKQSEVQPQKVPVRVRKWRGAEAEAVWAFEGGELKTNYYGITVLNKLFRANILGQNQTESKNMSVILLFS